MQYFVNSEWLRLIELQTIIEELTLRLQRLRSNVPHLVPLYYQRLHPGTNASKLQDLNLTLRFRHLKLKLQWTEWSYRHLQHNIRRLQPHVRVLERKVNPHLGRLFIFGLVTLFVISWSSFLYQGFSSYGSRRKGWSSNPIHNATLGVRSSKIWDTEHLGLT